MTIYGTVDVSGQGYNQTTSKSTNQNQSGNVFALTNNSSLIGFKGTEDLGNGLKALFQAETTLNILGTDDGSGTASGQLGGVAAQNQHGVFSALRDSFVGLNSKYGTGLMGYNSTPFRASLNSFDVMPGATGSGKIEQIMGTMRFTPSSVGAAASTSSLAFASAIRATSIAYAMPTLYGFNGSIAYTGSNNNGNNNSSTIGSSSCSNSLSSCTATPQSVFGFNLGWTGYGVNIQGAFQQANNNYAPTTAATNANNVGDYTSYLVGAAYTGLPGLKASVVYNRNTLGTNGTVGTGNAGSTVTNGAGKLTNNQLYAGASYRFGNWEPRVSAVWNSDINGSQAQQLGSRQWTLNTGYYLSKRTQVYGLISNLNNSANQSYTFGQQSANLKSTNGQNNFTYGLGLRTNF